jgi:hypothetical protein
VVGVVLTDPVGIVIPGSFEQLTDAQQVFCLARRLASIAQRTQVVAALGAPTTELLLAGTAAVVGIEPDAAGFDPAQVAETGRSLSKAIPWLSKGRFEEVARRYLADPPANLSALLGEVDRAALRVALVLCDDLGCLQLIRKRGPALLGLDAAELAPTIDDLLKFWISSNAMAIRRQLGLA